MKDNLNSFRKNLLYQPGSIHINIVDGFENDEYTYTLFIDLSQAFDCVSHRILLTVIIRSDKLEHYGNRGVALKLYESYLLNRLISVHANN